MRHLCWQSDQLEEVRLELELWVLLFQNYYKESHAKAEGITNILLMSKIKELFLHSRALFFLLCSQPLAISKTEGKRGWETSHSDVQGIYRALSSTASTFLLPLLREQFGQTKPSPHHLTQASSWNNLLIVGSIGISAQSISTAQVFISLLSS